MIYHVGVADGEGAAVSFPDLSICEMSDFLFFFFSPSPPKEGKADN